MRRVSSIRITSLRDQVKCFKNTTKSCRFSWFIWSFLTLFFFWLFFEKGEFTIVSWWRDRLCLALQQLLLWILIPLAVKESHLFCLSLICFLYYVSNSTKDLAKDVILLWMKLVKRNENYPGYKKTNSIS